MEDHILLDMYRSSWDAFLEAYKTKIDQVESFKKLSYEYADTLEGEGYSETSEDVRGRIKEILEA